MIQSALVAFWALHSVFRDSSLLLESIEFLDEYFFSSSIEIAYYLAKFGSGLINTAVVLFLWLRGGLASAGEAEIVANPAGRRFGFGGYLLALAAAPFLIFGTVVTVHWLLSIVFVNV